MHAFVAAVLLRVAGLDALDLDAKAEPQNRELREIEEGIWTGKRHTIIGTDGLGQAELPEGSLKHRKGVSFPGSRERLAGKDIAARRVSDRQRIAVAPIGQHELALVVRAPQVIPGNDSAVPVALLRRLVLRLTKPWR